MVGVSIPIEIEGGGGVKHGDRRAGSEGLVRRTLKKKNSRQKCGTFNIKIELEGRGGREPAERKNGISSKGQAAGQVSATTKKMGRRRSSRELRANMRRQSSKDLKSGMIRRQSSRDLVTNMRHKDRQLSRVISGQSSVDVCLPSLDSRFTIRRDSINGLRIISKLDQTETEALAGLTDIALTEDKTEWSKFQREALKVHNMYRARHGVAELELCPALCVLAQQYADRLARTDTFQHSGDPDLGENLYWSWSSDPAWECGGGEAVVSWYEESPGYCYDREPRDCQAGHFTQLVWSQSSRLGAGVKKSEKTGKFYVVMKYDPPGNVIGSYTKHVNRPRN